MQRPMNSYFPIFFDPANNQISYSIHNPNQGNQTFIPINQDNFQRNLIPKKNNETHQNAIGNLTLNAQKLNQDLHNQNVRNIRLKENGAFWSINQKNQTQNIHNFEIIKKGGSEENPNKEKQICPGIDGSSFDSKNQQSNQYLRRYKDSEDSGSKYMNIQINIEFDQNNIENTKKNFKHVINENLKLIQSTMPEISNIKILFADSNTSTPKINSEVKSDQVINKSISLISTSEAFDLEAKTTIEQNLWNVLKNSLLFDSSKQNHKDIVNQTSKIVFQILNSINFSNNISFEKNFFRLFNLQIPIDKKLFFNLHYGSKIKILCYLFCKYFKKNIISLLYEEFYEDVNIPEICSDNRSKAMSSSVYFLDVSESKEKQLAKENKSYLEIQNKINLSTIFPNTEDNQLNWLLIRKLIILLIQHLALFKDYLKIKLRDETNFQNNKTTIEKLKSIIESQMMCEDQFEIDTSLLKLNLVDLVNKVSISDLQLYVALSNVDFLPKNTSKRVFFLNEQKEKNEFEMTQFERESILMPKIKRKDEKIKFVFKSIRKQLFNEFKLKSKNNHSVSKTKQLFNTKYLNKSEEAIKYFYSNDLSKKKLKILNECNKLVYNMKNYKNEKYIKDQVEISIYRKSEDFLNKTQMDLNEFKKILFDRQSKHTWILQDILNSIPAFEVFFVFPRHKKRIKKKKYNTRAKIC
jgi:hypothetical protein